MTPVRPLLLTVLPFFLLATALFTASGAWAQSRSSRSADVVTDSDPYSSANSVAEAVRQVERVYGGRLTFAQRRIITQAATTRRDEARAADQKFRATAARALGLTVAELDAKDRALREQERQRQREQSRRQQHQQQQQRSQAGLDDRTTRRRSSSSDTRRYRRKRGGTRRGTAATGGRTPGRR
jgi:hypothetical protein